MYQYLQNVQAYIGPPVTAVFLLGILWKRINAQASIITLSPSSPEWQKIHPKSIPFMIDYSDDQMVDLWLDPDFKAVTKFQSLFTETGNRSMKVTPIGKPSQWDVAGDSFSILA